ncbi:hypothetical protein EMIT0111MI5_100235 [Burkholderia sp. IT-111MI5]
MRTRLRSVNPRSMSFSKQTECRGMHRNMTEQEIFLLSSDASSDFSFARVWTRIAVNTAARRFALNSNPQRIRCHRRALGIHLFCPALSTPALHARTGVTQTFTVAPLRTKLEYHRHDATRCFGRTNHSRHAFRHSPPVYT